MKIKPIRNDRDYDAALVATSRLMDAEPGIPEGDEVEVLASLVEAYEAVRWPVEAPDPVSAIKRGAIGRDGRRRHHGRSRGPSPRSDASAD